MSITLFAPLFRAGLPISLAKRSNAAIEFDGAVLTSMDVSECGILTGGDITLVENALWRHLRIGMRYHDWRKYYDRGRSHVSTSHVSECGIMTGGDITLVGSGSTLDISGTKKYGLRLASAAVNVDVQEGAVLTIKDASGTGSADYTNSVRFCFQGGKCVVSTTGASGIRKRHCRRQAAASRSQCAERRRSGRRFPLMQGNSQPMAAQAIQAGNFCHYGRIGTPAFCRNVVDGQFVSAGGRRQGWILYL